MFTDEELALLGELVEDRVAHYKKMLNEARWAHLVTTETYVTGRLNRLEGIREKLRQAQERTHGQPAPDQTLTAA